MDPASYLVQRLQVQDEEIADLHSQLQYYVAAYNERTEKMRFSRLICHTASQTEDPSIVDSKETSTMTDEAPAIGPREELREAQHNDQPAKKMEISRSQYDKVPVRILMFTKLFTKAVFQYVVHHHFLKSFFKLKKIDL